ncbi:MAG: DMT family transporter [Patescibacteria group bacterium]
MDSWLYVALVAHFLYALVFVFDKYILSRPIKSSLSYAFYTSFAGGFIAIIIPFYDFRILGFVNTLIALAAGAAFSWALVLFYRTLQISEASRSVPFVGALVPIATLIFSFPLGLEKLTGQHLLSFFFLVAGGFLIVFGYKNDHFWHKFNMLYAISAAFLFGFSFALTKLVFNYTNFVSGLIWTRWGGFLFALVLLLNKKWREDIFETTLISNEKTAAWFFSSKLLGATAVVLQNYAIFLGSVVLVNALQATQYLFLLVLAGFLSVKLPKTFKESLDKAAIAQKVISIIIIGIGLAVLAIPQAKEKKLDYGITFSQKFAQELSNDWKRVYLDLLDDLEIRELRLIAYWDKVEPQENKFDFSDLDWQVAEAEKRGAKVILALGRKTPRWPECHDPNWLKDNLARDKKSKIKNQNYEKVLLNYIKTTVEHYRNNAIITAWQVENEPLFPFGNCEWTRVKILNKEIDLVKSLDDRPIILTDAGELGFAWPYLAAKSDIFGTTLYRYVHNRVLGDIEYSLIPTSFFRIKAWWAKSVWGKEILVSELQAEPWTLQPLWQVKLEDQYKTMNPEKFREVIKYAERSNFTKAYLWGAEWWWWLKNEKGNDMMWEEVKSVISNSRAMPAGRQE